MTRHDVRRDRALQPRIDPPTTRPDGGSIDPMWLRGRWPGAIEALGEETGILSIDDDWFLVFESDVPSTALFWDGLRWRPAEDS